MPQGPGPEIYPQVWDYRKHESDKISPRRKVARKMVAETIGAFLCRELEKGTSPVVDAGFEPV